MTHQVTVVIPTAGNRLDLLDRTLTSLAQCDLPTEYSETLVIENGRRQGVEKVVSKFSATLNTRYIFTSQANKSVALNAALESLAGRFIIFLDDDVRVARNTVVDYAIASDIYGIGHFFGGPIKCDYEGEAPSAWLARHLPCSAIDWSAPDPSKVDDIFFLGFNWAAFANDLIAAGGFDPNRGPGAKTGATGQETGMQRRLREHGTKSVYVPDALVWHYVPAGVISWRWARHRAYRDGIGQMLDPANQNSYFLGCHKYRWHCLLQMTENIMLAAVPVRSRFRLCRSWLYYERWRGARHALRNIRGGHLDKRETFQPAG